MTKEEAAKFIMQAGRAWRSAMLAMEQFGDVLAKLKAQHPEWFPEPTVGVWNLGTPTQEMLDDDVLSKINPSWFNDIVAKEVDLSKWDGTPVSILATDAALNHPNFPFVTLEPSADEPITTGGNP